MKKNIHSVRALYASLKGKNCINANLEIYGYDFGDDFIVEMGMEYLKKKNTELKVSTTIISTVTEAPGDCL